MGRESRLPLQPVESAIQTGPQGDREALVDERRRCALRAPSGLSWRAEGGESCPPVRLARAGRPEGVRHSPERGPRARSSTTATMVRGAQFSRAPGHELASTVRRGRTFCLVRTSAALPCGGDRGAYRWREALEAGPRHARRDLRSAPCSRRVDAHV
jgi:hypothetical protein